MLDNCFGCTYIIHQAQIRYEQDDYSRLVACAVPFPCFINTSHAVEPRDLTSLFFIDFSLMHPYCTSSDYFRRFIKL